jgi:hypothetical protein
MGERKACMLNKGVGLYTLRGLHVKGTNKVA